MLLKGHSEAELRFLAPKRDLPQLFGYRGENLGFLSRDRKLGVSESDLPPGAVALAPFSKREKGKILDLLKEEDFLKKYTEQDRSSYCI